MSLWEEQWALHCPHFKEGQAQIHLKEYGGPNKWLKMQPGPGFGDLSHPTTRLVLKMMLPLVQGKIVLDIGCGSGVLAIAAALAGAKKVFAIDIDTEAVAHAKSNAAKNGLNIAFELPQQLPKGTIALMNMIRTEQEAAWQALKPLYASISTVVTSGVLKEEKTTYLKEANERGWIVQATEQQKGWLGFLFER